MDTRIQTAEHNANLSAERAAIAAGSRGDLLSRASRFAARYLVKSRFRMPAAGPIVTFTFDDIPADAGAEGAACLEAHGARGTFYVASDLLGKRFGPWLFASPAQIGALAAKGHEIGCHTCSHVDVQTVDAVALAAEAARNQRALKAIDPRITLENFAYPYGSVGLLGKRIAGLTYRSCRGIRPGINLESLDLAQIRSVRLYDAEMSVEKLESLLRAVSESSAWLVFYTHDVSRAPTEQGTSLHLLEKALARSLAVGCRVLTVGQALDQLGVPKGREGGRA